MRILSVKQNLSLVNWDFANRSERNNLESIHPYPAKFISDIPRTFIEKLELPSGTRILDPFCGSGTTLVEAQRAGIGSVGVDLNPIACLISKVKTLSLRPGFIDAVLNVVEQARNLREVEIPNIPNLDHWFKNDIQKTVASITQVIRSNEYSEWSDQLKLTLSSILVRVSNQDSDTRYAAIDKAVRGEDVYSAFGIAACKLEKALSNRSWDFINASIIEGNTLELDTEKFEKNIGLVITSPPYPNAYEYWLYHKYRMWWLGFDPIAVKDKEIGARAHFFKKNAHTAENFVHQMTSTFAFLDKVTVKNAYICFVVGRSKIHGKLIDNGDIIDNVATKQGLVKEARIERVIKASRKSFNLSHANIKSESILVYRKD